MSNPVASILRAATRREGEPLNVLTFPTHEAYETGLAKTGHRFWAVRNQYVKDWDKTYRPVPDNYVLLNPLREGKQLPVEIDFDLVLSQNKAGQFQQAIDISRALHLPLICLEHTMPVPTWPAATLAATKNMRGHVNVFISEYSRRAWGWGGDDCLVIHHGIDAETFSPNDLLVDRSPHLLSVVNDWRNRDWCCGFSLWRQVSAQLPVEVVGATPGLSVAARSVAELVLKYRSADVFLNTSLVSPVPTALLEAMACGCAVVSTATCMIPEVVEDGVNGFVSNDPKVLRDRCRTLLADHGLCRRLGEAARKTVLEKFSNEVFVREWDRALLLTASHAYKGE